MEINYLKEFIILAQTNNFLEASEILFSSQSSLSKHIKNLETELGVPLFDRTTRKVGINQYGQLLLPFAKQIVDLYDQYTSSLQSSLNTTRETLTLGSIPPLAQYKITDIMVDFKKSRPQSTINVMEAGSEELREMLRQKKCDLAFIRDSNAADDYLDKITYAIDALVAVLPIAHPLAMQKSIPLQFLANEDFYLIDKVTNIYRICVNACQHCGFEPKIVFTDNKEENLVEMVSKGMGVSLLPKRLALYAANPGIAILDITPTVSTTISLCSLKGADLSAAARHFVQCAEFQKTNSNLLNN